MFQRKHVFYDSSGERPPTVNYVWRVDVILQVLCVLTDPGAGPPALGLDLLLCPLLLRPHSELPDSPVTCPQGQISIPTPVLSDPRSQCCLSSDSFLSLKKKADINAMEWMYPPILFRGSATSALSPLGENFFANNQFQISPRAVRILEYERATLCVGDVPRL